MIIVMDLGLLDSDFVMDNRELILHTVIQAVQVYSVMIRDSHTAPSQHSGMKTLILRGIRCQQTGVFSILGESSYLEPWWWPDPRRTSSTCTCWFRTRPPVHRTRYPHRTYNMWLYWGWVRLKTWAPFWHGRIYTCHCAKVCCVRPWSRTAESTGWKSPHYSRGGRT